MMIAPGAIYELGLYRKNPSQLRLQLGSSKFPVLSSGSVDTILIDLEMKQQSEFWVRGIERFGFFNEGISAVRSSELTP